MGLQYPFSEVAIMIKNSKKNISAIAAAMAAYLAPIPAESVGHSFDILANTQKTVTYSQVNDGFVYIPIDDAVLHIINITKRFRFHLQNLRLEWEEKQIPIDNNSMSVYARENFNALNQHIIIASLIVSATKEALSKLPKKQTELHKKIVQFGRAAADMRYTVEDIFSFIKSTQLSPDVSSENGGLIESDLHSIIRSEHKSLGLDEPKFY